MDVFGEEKHSLYSKWIRLAHKSSSGIFFSGCETETNAKPSGELLDRRQEAKESEKFMSTIEQDGSCHITLILRVF